MSFVRPRLFSSPALIAHAQILHKYKTPMRCCGEVQIKNNDGSYRVICPVCGKQGAEAFTSAMAVCVWNRGEIN